MTKAELIKETATKAGVNQSVAKAAIEACFGVIETSLRNGEAVVLTGIGRFFKQSKPEREGINPITKEKITIAARDVVKFKTSDNFGK